MKRRIRLLLVLVLCLCLGGVVGCSSTTRSFVRGAVVGAAVTYVWCAHCSDYVQTCRHRGHCRH